MTDHNADGKRFGRVTVYVDLASESELLPLITECATALATQSVVVAQADMPTGHPGTTAPPSSRSATSIALIKLWQAEEADVYTRDVNNTVAFMNAAELLITDKNTMDGAVTYALYRRQMPVLSLCAEQLPARTAVQQLLYTTLAPANDSAEGRRAAVKAFLTFPAQNGRYTAMDSSSSPASPPTTTTGTTTTTTTTTGLPAGVDVVVNADGYPVALPHVASSAGDVMLPPPPTLFANVVAELQHSTAEHMDVLRRRNPLLPGILEAFHRYQNRGVVRAALHRGMTVVTSDAVAVSAAPETPGMACVKKFVMATESDEETQMKKLATAEATLAKFEGHWLELPLAQRSA